MGCGRQEVALSGKDRIFAGKSMANAASTAAPVANAVPGPPQPCPEA